MITLKDGTLVTEVASGGWNPSNPDVLDTGSYGGHGRMTEQRAHNRAAVRRANPGLTPEQHAEAALLLSARYRDTGSDVEYLQAEAHAELAGVAPRT